MAASDDQNIQGNPQDDSELEQYGVWVKAGPEDVDDDEVGEAFDLTDLGDAELDEAEHELLSMGDEPDSLEADESPLELEEDSLDLSSLDDELTLDDELSLDDDDADEPISLDSASEAPTESDDELELETLEEDDSEETAAPDGEELLALDDTEELGMDTTIELDVAEPLDAEPADGIGEHDIDLGPAVDEDDELEALDDAEDADDDAIDIESNLPGDVDDLTLDLDSLDVDAFDEPTEGTAETPDIEPPAEMDESSELDILTDDEPDLDSLDMDSDTEVAEIDLSTLPADDDDFGDLSEVTIEESDDDELPELEQDDEVSLDMEFDDVAAVEEELTESIDFDLESPEPEPAATATSDEKSLSLLESIERELSSIRTELSDLKGELATLRSTPGQPSQPAAPVDGDDEAGFFEEDDDETIALTGAELDNIMNTAEFTEETGQPTDLDESELDAFAGLEIDEDDDDQPVQEITLEDAPQDDEPLDLDLGSADAELAAEPDDDVLAGSEDAVEALASMDIDAELADIEELDDSTQASEQLEALPEEPSEDKEAIEMLDEEELPETEDLIEDELETDVLAEDPSAEALSAEEQSLLMSEDTLPDAPAVEPEPQVSAGDQQIETAQAMIDQIPTDDSSPIPENIKGELRSVLNYMDQLLDSLPEEKIQEFANSDHFKVYQRLFEELGLKS